MKRLLDEIASSKYKWWLIILLAGAVIVAFISAHITGSNIAETLLVGVFVSFLINLVSSLITIVFIEERDRREMQKNASYKQNVVISKLNDAIKKYNCLFANIYKATSSELVNIDSLCANLYYDIDGFVKRLNMLDFLKDSYVAPFEQSWKDGIKRYQWIDVFISETIKYIETMHSIQENYLFCLTDNGLIEPLSGIAVLFDVVRRSEIMSMVKTFPDCISQLGVETNLIYPHGVEIKIVYIMYKTIDTMAHTKDLMSAIDRITARENFKISPSMFTAENIAPKLGSGIDEQYIHRKVKLEQST